MEERDWQKDWSLTRRASDGPWLYSDARRFDPAYWSKGGFTLYCVTVEHPNGRWEAIFTKTAEDAHFIAQAREALPYWLQRVKELEERLRQLEGRQCETCLWWIPWDNGKWGTCDKGAPPDDPKIRRYLMMETRPDFGCACWTARCGVGEGDRS